MALPPLSFQVPQQRRSIIEEALGAALGVAATEIIRAPFERRRANEAARRDLANLEARLPIELRGLQQSLKAQSDAQVAAIVPTLMERIRGQAAARLELSKTNVLPGTEALLDVARTNIGGLTPEQVAAPTSLAEFEEVKDVLGNIIQSGELVQSRERTRLTGEYNRDIRTAGLYADVTKADVDTWGNVINTNTGELLGLRDIQLIKTGEAKLAQVPEAAGDLARLRELDSLRRAGKLQSIQLNQDAFKKVRQDFSGMEAGPIMTMFGRSYPFLLYRFDNKGKPQRVDAGNEGKLSVYLQGNPDLLDAFAAHRLAQDMNDIKAAQLATGFQLSGRTLGYLSLMYQSEGKTAYEHPDAIIPAEIPEEILRELGRTRVSAVAAPQRAPGAVSANPLDNPAGPIATPGRKGSVFTGLDISAEQQYPEYLTLQEGLQTRLRARTFPGVPYDSTKYREFGQDFVNQHATPEKALAWYRSLGVADDKLFDLIEGDEATKKRALNERLSFALGALQNSRDAILAK